MPTQATVMPSVRITPCGNTFRRASLAPTLKTRREPSGYVHAVTEDVIVLDHDVADIEADPEAHPATFRLAFVSLLKGNLNFDRTANRVERAGEFGEHAIAGGVRDPASMLSNELVEDGAAG